MFISQFEAEAILEPYRLMIWESITSAWVDYELHYEHVRHLHTSRTRANIIHDHIVFNARKIFDGIEGICLHDINGLFLVEIQEKVLLRFKKLDEEKRCHNIQTQQTVDFFGQMELPYMPPHAIRLIAGYELNSLQTEIKAISITCPNGSNNAWYFEVESPVIESAEIVDFPTVEVANIPKRVHVKEKEVKEKHG